MTQKKAETDIYLRFFIALILRLFPPNQRNNPKQHDGANRAD